MLGTTIKMFPSVWNHGEADYQSGRSGSAARASFSINAAS